jgi:hypothetical protein
MSWAFQLGTSSHVAHCVSNIEGKCADVAALCEWLQDFASPSLQARVRQYIYSQSKWVAVGGYLSKGAASLTSIAINPKDGRAWVTFKVSSCRAACVDCLEPVCQSVDSPVKHSGGLRSALVQLGVERHFQVRAGRRYRQCWRQRQRADHHAF